MEGNDPRSSLQYFDRLGLYSTIFTDPTAKDFPVPSTDNWSIVYDCLHALKANETPGSIYHALVRSEDAKYNSWLLAALAPWASIPNPPQSGPKPPILFGTRVIQEGIKANSKICNLVNGAFKNYAQLTELKNAVVEGLALIHERDTVGMRIRKWNVDGGNWRLQALFALLVEVMGRVGSQGVPLSTVLSEWQGLIDHLESMDIMDAPAEKPLIDGKMLMAEFNAKGGVWTKGALDICMAWQLRNPGATSPEDLKAALEEVRKKSDELQIPMKK